MRGFEQDHLHALCIPGVQNTPMDWQLLQDATSEFLDIDIADEQPLASKNIPAEDWRKEVIQYERSVAQAHNADVILAHSYKKNQHRLRGAFRSMQQLYKILCEM